jgi:hypothetical protein
MIDSRASKLIALGARQGTCQGATSPDFSRSGRCFFTTRPTCREHRGMRPLACCCCACAQVLRRKRIGGIAASSGARCGGAACDSNWCRGYSLGCEGPFGLGVQGSRRCAIGSTSTHRRRRRRTSLQTPRRPLGNHTLYRDPLINDLLASHVNEELLVVLDDHRDLVHAVHVQLRVIRLCLREVDVRPPLVIKRRDCLHDRVGEKTRKALI